VWWPTDSINVVQWLQGTGTEYDLFNWAMTIVVCFGLIGWGIGLLCQIISRS
jgi:hypothetical protein